MPVTLRQYDAKQPGHFPEEKGIALIKEQGARGLRSIWRYRYTFAGKRQELSLVASGNLPKDRRTLNQWQDWLLEGKNPKHEREKEREAQQQKYGDTLATAVRDFVPKKTQRIANEKNRRRLEVLFDDYVLPRYGTFAVTDIGEAEVVAMLEPIWTTKYPTAKKVLSAVNQLMRYKGRALNLAQIRFDLPEPRHKVEHYDKVPLETVPGIVKSLWDKGNGSDLFLLAVILTASRAGPVRFMRHEEIDYNAALWHCPKTKTGQPFDFPLNEQAVAVLKRAQKRAGGSAWAFPQARNPAKPMDENSGRLRIQKLTNSKATVHGFRSVLHDWADPRGFDHLIIELTLQHQSLSEVEKAYQRSQYLERRRQLLAEWGDFCWSQIV